MDLGIEVIIELFSEENLKNVFALTESSISEASENAQRIYALRESYLRTINQVIIFLQGKNETLARQICTGQFLPQAARFEVMDDLNYSFGSMGIQDRAKHLATLYLEDLSDFIVECVDEDFGFSRYAERLGNSANSFDSLYDHLGKEPSYIDELTLQILKNRIDEIKPKLIAFSVPFPGNLYSAFRCAQYIRKHYAGIEIVMGGGFPNTELRQLSDVRVFEFFHYIALDDGELPIELLTKHILGSGSGLKRTFLLEGAQVVYRNDSKKSDYKQSEVGVPDYSDLLLDRYISVIEIANPMHSLWSDGRWNKLTIAHGCYWGKCTFCDISLDYIRLYEPVAASQLVDRMEALIAQTGERGFHFVDEAAPPAMMREIALEILRRKLVVTWWTNIRFEKNFTSDLCQLLASTGCVAVSGGLEVASNRLLELIDKGVTVEQVARVTSHFTNAGIMVHSYLMYGYPTQTIQETVDSLEVVRQLFEQGTIQSGFWHQFALTAHSPVGLNPDEFGVIPQVKEATFAHNDIDFIDTSGIDHDQFSSGLKKSIFNYMHGIGFESPLQEWFDFEIPETTVKKNYIASCLQQDPMHFDIKPSARVYWIGVIPRITIISKTKKGKEVEFLQLDFHDKTESYSVQIDRQKGEWLIDLLNETSVTTPNVLTYGAIKERFENHFEHFQMFWFSDQVEKLRAHGLLVL